MIEQWAKIDGINYKISSIGRVQNLKTGWISYGGNIKKYKALRIKGFSVMYIHRLVGKYFIPNPDNLPEINHKDCDTRNNNVYNLEWSTRLDNIIHAHKTLRYKHKFSVPDEIQILKLYQVYGFTYKEVGLLFGCGWGSIRKVVDRLKEDVNLYASL